jgi:exosortase
VIAVVVLTVLAACWPTCLSLHEKWVDTANLGDTHGYLVAGVSAFLLWQANRGVGRSRAPVRFWPVFSLAGVGLIWVVGVRSGLAAVEFALLPILLWLAIRAAAGPEAGQRSMFGVAYLYFAMPLWSIINPILQGVTVQVVRAMLRVVGIPSHFVGNVVQIPAGSFEIAGGCSGLHFFVVALAIAALMGEMRGDDWRGRMKLLLLAAALALVCNWLRVFTIILAGHFTHMQHYLVAQSHYGYGWMLFALTMVVFFVLERRVDVTGTRPPATRPEFHEDRGATGYGSFRPAAAVVVAMLLMTTMQWLAARPARATLTAFVPSESASFAAVEPVTWQPVIVGADMRQNHRFILPNGDLVEQHQFFFLNQRQGKELGGYHNDPTAGDVAYSAGTTSLAGHPTTLFETREAGGESWLVAVSYGSGGGRYATALPAQLSYALQSMARLRSVPSTVTVWRAQCRPDCQTAEQLLSQFVATKNTDL